jgi:hypothetical protein
MRTWLCLLGVGCWKFEFQLQASPNSGNGCVLKSCHITQNFCYPSDFTAFNFHWKTFIQGWPNLMNTTAAFDYIQNFKSCKYTWIGWHRCFATCFWRSQFIYILSVHKKGLIYILPTSDTNSSEELHVAHDPQFGHMLLTLIFNCNIIHLSHLQIIIILKITVLWNLTSCSLINVYWCYGRTCCLHLQDWRFLRNISNHLLTTWRHIPEDSEFYSHCHEHLSSHLLSLL